MEKGKGRGSSLDVASRSLSTVFACDGGIGCCSYSMWPLGGRFLVWPEAEVAYWSAKSYRRWPGVQCQTEDFQELWMLNVLKCLVWLSVLEVNSRV